MAGDHDRDAVLSIRRSHCPRRFGIAHASGEFGVGDGLTVGDLFEAAPHGALERRAFRGERQVKLPALASEVFVELLSGSGQHSARGGFGPTRKRLLGLALFWESDVVQGCVVPGQQQWADGTVQVTVAHSRYATIEISMALAILLFVFFVVVAMIALFIFPPTKWVQWFYNTDDKK
jgi:hypothetical protein